MDLHFYQSSSGKNLIFDYIDSLPINEQTDGYTVLKYLKDGKMDCIQFKPWEKKIYEVYFYKHNRIFYVTADKDNIYILHACRKQKIKLKKEIRKLLRHERKS